MENFVVTDFNYFDAIIGTIVLLLAIKGFLNGFIKEVFGLLGLIGGVYFGSRFAGDAATFIDANFLHMDNSAILKLVGFLSVLITIWIGATFIGTLFSKLTTVSGLGFINRLLGLVAGGGKYFIIFALIVTALSNIPLLENVVGKYTQNSILYPYLKETGSAIIKIDPKTLGLNISEKTSLSKEENQSKKTSGNIEP